jgi:hypothetical protein
VVPFRLLGLLGEVVSEVREVSELVSLPGLLRLAMPPLCGATSSWRLDDSLADDPLLRLRFAAIDLGRNFSRPLGSLAVSMLAFKSGRAPVAFLFGMMATLFLSKQRQLCHAHGAKTRTNFKSLTLTVDRRLCEGEVEMTEKVSNLKPRGGDVAMLQCCSGSLGLACPTPPSV